MTMTEETTVEKKTPKKKAAKRKVARKPAAPAAVKPTGIYEGLTVTDCCDGCNVDGCVISGKNYCAHPRKGGLQSREIQDPAALRRSQEAKRVIGKQVLEFRDT